MLLRKLSEELERCGLQTCHEVDAMSGIEVIRLGLSWPSGAYHGCLYRSEEGRLKAIVLDEEPGWEPKVSPLMWELYQDVCEAEKVHPVARMLDKSPASIGYLRETTFGAQAAVDALCDLADLAEWVHWTARAADNYILN